MEYSFIFWGTRIRKEILREFDSLKKLELKGLLLYSKGTDPLMDEFEEVLLRDEKLRLSIECLPVEDV